MKPIQDIVEKSIFGVCSHIGERMGIAISTVRLYFIYLSFVTWGSTLVVYFFLAFWLNVKEYIHRGRQYLID